MNAYIPPCVQRVRLSRWCWHTIYEGYVYARAMILTEVGFMPSRREGVRIYTRAFIHITLCIG